MHIHSYQDLHAKVSQLLVVRASGHAFDSQREYPLWELSNRDLKVLLRGGVGGVILHGGTVQEIKARSELLQSWGTDPILLCADVEEGVGQRFAGGTLLPPPMTLAFRYLKYPEESINMAKYYGECVGNQARRSGLNWVLGPVCDVNSNPLNPVINMRAWGDDPQTVATLASAFHKGLVSQGVLSCAKHFPGHGDTSSDSHLGLPSLANDLARLEELELVPFKALISEGVNSVMTAHILLAKIDPTYPATLSKELLTKLLRQNLRFQGMIVTDALVMQAITDRYGSGEAALLALEAGADLILMPQKPFEAIDAIVEGIKRGRLPLQRLEESLDRRLTQMKKLQLALENFKETDSICETEELERPKDLFFVDKLLDESLEVRNSIQIKNDSEIVNLVRVDSCFPGSILNGNSPALTVPQKHGFRNFIYHPLGVSPWQDDPQEPLAIDRFNGGPFLLQLFLRGNPFVGDQHIKEPWVQVVTQLQKRNLLVGLVLYGSYYSWENMIQVVSSSIPVAYSPGQMSLAQEKILKLLFN